MQSFELFVLVLWITGCFCQCGRDEYKRCTMMADPLLKDPHLIYPDNLKDIDHVCRTWTQFVDCVQKFTDSCFTESKRKEFNRAVESPVNLVHQICTSAEYQKEYLTHAVCMRAILTDDSHCGRHYRHLVNQVSGEPATATLCCSHLRFRECILDQTRRACEHDAAPFAKSVLDQAMGFIRDQCVAYKPDPIECPGSEYYVETGIMSSWNEPVKIQPPEDRRTTSRKMDDWSAQDANKNGIDGGDRWTYTRDMTLETTVTTEGVEDGRQDTTMMIEQTQSLDKTVVSNMIDEPNQQGLSNENSAALNIHSYANYIFIICLEIISECYRRLIN